MLVYLMSLCLCLNQKFLDCDTNHLLDVCFHTESTMQANMIHNNKLIRTGIRRIKTTSKLDRHKPLSFTNYSLQYMILTSSSSNT